MDFRGSLDFFKREKYVADAGIQTPDRPAPSLVAVGRQDDSEST